MEPGVPFSLLGAVQLLAIAAAVGLAAAALLRRTTAGFVVALGSLVLAGVEIDTALRLGTASSDPLGYLRAAASLVLAVGLLSGGLRPRTLPTTLYGVVVPLAASAGPGVAAGVASLVAAASGIRSRRDAVGISVGTGLVLWGAASFVSTSAANGSHAPLAVLVLRGVGAVAVLVALGLLAQISLLSKVVSAILAGVLAMAVAAIAVVGNVVVDSYETQAKQTVQQAATSRLLAIGDEEASISPTADLLEQLCTSSPSAKENAIACAQVLDPQPVQGKKPVQFVASDQHDFLAYVPLSGAARLIAQRSSDVTASVVLGLGQDPTVQEVLHPASDAEVSQSALTSVVRLSGPRSSIALIAVSSVQPTPGAAPTGAYVYGVVLDNDYAAATVDLDGYGLYLLAGSPLQVVASNKSQDAGKQVLGLAEQAGVEHGIPSGGLTIGSQGSAPAVAFMALTRPGSGIVAGYVAVTRDATEALQAERRALRLLVITALAALAIVALFAAFLGRRTVDPVRRLTLAAQRIAAGDLTVRTDVTSRDEVGTLADAFDDMTASLSSLTGDLRDSAARLGTVLASMSDGLLATDGEGIVTSVNRAALELLGLEAVDALGEQLSVVADVRDAAGVSLADPTLRLRDEPAEVLRADGSKVPVRVAISSLQGDAPGVVMVLRDTTREREVERMKTEFLSNVSHELRTPLTPIRGYAEILVSKPGLASDKVTQFSTVIRDESLKMNRVVDLLVDVAALEAGRVSIVPRPVAAKELLDARLAVWQARTPDRRKDLRKRVATGLPALHVDPTWFGKALDELIDNAVKYSKPGTPIVLGAAWAPGGERVRISVKDAGPGIAEEDQATLFTSFEQVDGSATRRVGGLGLGLSFVRRLAEDAGFPLSVSSRLGKGAEFSLDVPVSDEPLPRRKR